jgi:hypothetical protein
MLARAVETFRGQPFVTAREEGYVAYAFYEIEESKLAEALMELFEYLSNLRTVLGLRFKFETLLPATEAMQIIGMQAPPPKKTSAR